MISKKPSPAVSTVRTAVAICSTGVLWLGDKPVTARRTLAVVQHLFVRLGNRLDQPMPNPAHEGHHAVEISASSVQPAAIIAHAGRLGHRPGWQGQPARDEIPLEQGVLGAQTPDLFLEHGAVLWHCLTGPTDGPLAARRHLARLHVEPNEAVRDLAERVTALFAFRRALVSPNGQHGHHQTEAGNESGKDLVDHGRLPRRTYNKLRCKKPEYRIGPW